MVKTKKYNSAFTLVEILVIVFIISIIATISLSTFINARNVHALEKDANRLVELIERARSRTLSSYEDSQYGVHIGSQELTLFTGITYDVNNPDNIIEPLDSRVEISAYTLTGGGNDIIFERLSGETFQAGTITVSLVNEPTELYVITVTATGLTQVQ